jgi:hypothetical protein
MAARARSRFDRDDDDAPKSDVYTGLLALSLIAMMISSLLLFMDYSQYASSKAPAVSIPQPKGREGLQTGQLPPPLLHLPPPVPIGERPFTRGKDVAANPVNPAGGEEAQAPVVVPSPPEPVAPPPAPPKEPIAEAPKPSAPAATEAAPPAPEPVAPPPPPAPTTPPTANSTPPAQPSAPPPLPKSIRNLPN